MRCWRRMTACVGCLNRDVAAFRLCNTGQDPALSPFFGADTGPLDPVACRAASETAQAVPAGSIAARAGQANAGCIGCLQQALTWLHRNAPSGGQNQQHRSFSLGVFMNRDRSLPSKKLNAVADGFDLKVSGVDSNFPTMRCHPTTLSRSGSPAGIWLRKLADDAIGDPGVQAGKPAFIRQVPRRCSWSLLISGCSMPVLAGFWRSRQLITWAADRRTAGNSMQSTARVRDIGQCSSWPMLLICCTV